MKSPTFGGRGFGLLEGTLLIVFATAELIGTKTYDAITCVVSKIEWKIYNWNNKGH